MLRVGTMRIHLKSQFSLRNQRFLRILKIALLVCLISNCASGHSKLSEQYRKPSSDWPPFEVDKSVDAEELAALPDLPPVEWHTSATERLGTLFFFDPRLSASGQIACVTCHHPSLGWTDGRRVSAGHDRHEGSRNSMTLLNAAHFDQLFWDGRADGVLDLMLKPIESPIEMNSSIDETINRINAIDAYGPDIELAFGDSAMTPSRLAKTLASFVRTRVSMKSRFDRFVGEEYSVFDEQQIHGLHLFRTKARCMNCHHGPLFSDGKFHHTGLSYYDRRFEDLGRFDHTGELDDRGKFRTPTLRDLEFTGPWMHNGLFTNFTGILRMYNHGITFNSRVQEKPGAPPLSPLIRPLGMDKKEIAALESFLRTLSRIPHFVETPTLPGFDQQGNTTAQRENPVKAQRNLFENNTEED